MSEQANEHPVIAYSNAARAKLLKGERARAVRLVNVYGTAYTRLQAHIAALTRRWIAANETGALTPTQMRALDTYKSLQKQIEHEIARFGVYAGEEMEQAARAAMAQAIKDAKREVQLSLPLFKPMQIDRVWRNLPNESVEMLLGMTETGSPLRSKMDKELGSAVAQRAADALLTAVALGQNPRVTARTVKRELGVGLVWAMQTFRTAQLWAYRTTKHKAWAQNPRLYKGWAWHAQLGDPRTCPACIAMHGTLHPPDEVLNDHFNGRCAPIIQTPSYADILGIDPIEGDVSPAERVQSGAEWFAAQPDAVQMQTLGGAAFRAYKDGAITMDQGERGIVGVYESDVYGSMRHARSLKSILGDDAAPFYAWNQ